MRWPQSGGDPYLLRSSPDRPAAPLRARPMTPTDTVAPQNWHCVLSPSLDGASNMRIDRRLQVFTERSRRPVTLVRFYGWTEPTVTLGCHQTPELAFAKDYCHAQGIPWVHRPTGGRAVFHHDELTYMVTSNDGRHFPLQSVRRIHHKISSALQAGLSRLGIRPVSAPGDRILDRALTRAQKPCFVAPSRHELVQGTRKMVGSAQKKTKRGFLQHGSIPLMIHYDLMAAALGVDAEYLRSRTISVSEAAGRPVSFGELSQALIRGFQKGFGIRFRKTIDDSLEWSLGVASGQAVVL